MQFVIYENYVQKNTVTISRIRIVRYLNRKLQRPCHSRRAG